jgi:hypothetical protein
VRSASVRSTTKGKYNAGQQALSNFGEAVLAGGRVGPLGLVIGVPLGAVGAVIALVDKDRCPPRVRAALGNVDQWVGSTLGTMPVLADVTNAARQSLRGSGGPQILTSSAGASLEAKEQEVTTLGAQLGTANLILADILVEFGEMSSACRITLSAKADIRVQSVGQPPAAAPRFSLVAMQDDVPVEDWARNPEMARVELRRLL